MIMVTLIDILKQWRDNFGINRWWTISNKHCNVVIECGQNFDRVFWFDIETQKLTWRDFD